MEDVKNVNNERYFCLDNYVQVASLAVRRENVIFETKKHLKIVRLSYGFYCLFKISFRFYRVYLY